MQFDTERLVLREFEEADAEACNEYEREPDVVRYQSFAPRTVAESLAYIQESMASAREVPRSTYDFAVVLRGGERVIGRCGLKVAFKFTACFVLCRLCDETPVHLSLLRERM